MSLQRRVRLVVLAACLVPSAIATATLSHLFVDFERQATQRRLGEVVAGAAASFDDRLLAVARDLRALSEPHWLQGPDADIARVLARHTQAKPYLKALFWVSPAGVIKASSKAGLAGRKMLELSPEAGAVMERVLRGRPGQMHVLDLDQASLEERALLDTKAYPLNLEFFTRTDDGAGRPMGVLVAEVEPEALLSVLAVHAAMDAGDIRLGVLNARREVLMSSVADARLLEPHLLSSHIPFLEPGDKEVSLVSGGHGPVFLASAEMHGVGAEDGGRWTVVAEIPEAEVVANARMLLVVTLCALLSTTAAVGAMAVGATRGFVARIAALRDASQRFARGDLDGRVDERGADELAELAQAFNGMAADLAARQRAESDARDQQAALAHSLEEKNQALGARNEQITQLAEMTTLLQTCENVEDAQPIVERYLRALFGDGPSAVYLLKSSQNLLDRLAAAGTPPPEATFEPAACWAMRRGRVHVSRQEGELRCRHAGPGASLCVPLSAGGNAVGLLHVAGEVVAPESQGLASLFAEQLALSLANLRLRASLRDQTIRDPLTGLHNRRFLEAAFERELALAERGGGRVAALMLDVDHFKRFNDQFGHDAGDAALRAFGRALRGAARTTDLVCRFGGEEFTVVLIGDDAAKAVEWSDRLRAQLTSLELTSHGQPLPPITTSIGIAVYPDHGTDLQTLLQAADAALYVAKRSGRDRAVVAGTPLTRERKKA